MRWIVLAVAFALALAGCRSEGRRATISAAAGAQPPSNPAGPYFPDGTFEPAVRQIETDWYTEQLRALQEPPLASLDQDEAVRFTWLRTFEPPITVRLQRRGSEFSLVAARGTGTGGYEPGVVDLRRQLEIDGDTWSRVQQALVAADFDGPQPPDEYGRDGAEWIVERVVHGRYRLVERWQPEAGGPNAEFRAACLLMLGLAGSDLVTGRVY